MIRKAAAVKRYLLATLFLSLALACAYPIARAAEEELRCEGKVIHLGDSKARARNVCGDPDSTTSRGSRYEEWSYNFGESKFMYLLKFEGDALRSIEQLDRGYHDAKKEGIPRGPAQVVVKNTVTESGARFLWVRGILRNAGGATAFRTHMRITAQTSNDSFVNFQEAYPKPREIAPGQEATFEAAFNPDDRIRKFDFDIQWEDED
jgi:hypothetical protein